MHLSKEAPVDITTAAERTSPIDLRKGIEAI